MSYDDDSFIKIDDPRPGDGPHIRGYRELGGKMVEWTWQDELMDLLDKAENYAGQYEHCNYSAMRELVRDIRRIVKKCDILSKGGD